MQVSRSVLQGVFALTILYGVVGRKIRRGCRREGAVVKWLDFRSLMVTFCRRAFSFQPVIFLYLEGSRSVWDVILLIRCRTLDDPEGHLSPAFFTTGQSFFIVEA